MKKLILLLALLFCVFSVFSQVKKIREFSSVPYEHEIETNEFTVLDINFENNLVAFKHVFRLRTIGDEIGEVMYEACNCHYTGMDSVPYSGVVLGVYDLSKQDYVKIFPIYNSVYDKDNCTDYKLSLVMLDSAKLYFLENKLDIVKKPQPIELVLEEEEGNTVTKFEFNEISFMYNNRYDMDSNVFSMTTGCDLFTYKNGKLDSENMIYSILQQDFYYMGSGGWVEYLSVFEKNGEFVFLNRFYHSSSLAGTTDSETYHFSPVFKLSDFK